MKSLGLPKSVVGWCIFGEGSRGAIRGVGGRLMRCRVLPFQFPGQRNGLAKFRDLFRLPLLAGVAITMSFASVSAASAAPSGGPVSPLGPNVKDPTAKAAPHLAKSALKRPATAMTLIVAAIAVAFALVLPANYSFSIGTSSPSAPAAAASPARGADPAALELAAQQHVTLAQAELRLSWQQAVPSLSTALSSQLPTGIFGGIWIALNHGDRVTVGVVSLNPRTRATVTRAVHAAGLSAATDLVQVRYSLRQLVLADRWLGIQLDKLSRLNASPSTSVPTTVRI